MIDNKRLIGFGELCGDCDFTMGGGTYCTNRKNSDFADTKEDLRAVYAKKENCPRWNALEVPETDGEISGDICDVVTMIDGAQYRVRIDKEPSCSR